MKKPANSDVRFAVCVKDDQPWFEVRKVYGVLPDDMAARMNYIRVVDEFAEDYLYPQDNFVLLDLPKEAQQRVHHAAKPPQKSKQHPRHRTQRSRTKPLRTRRAS